MKTRQKIQVPPILMEGDQPSTPMPAGPGMRYATGPAESAASFEAEGELPEAYGTGRLLLTARDPHWLYAHWDLTRKQQLQANAKSRDGHLVLRIYREKVGGTPATELHVHPESTFWFVHVPHAETRYVGELGYYTKQGWTRISVSGTTLTPPDAVSPETREHFATIPIDVPFTKLVSLVKSAVEEHVPLAEALDELRREGHPDLPPTLASAPPPAAEWTPEQEEALSRVLSMDEVRRVWMGSLEITELIRRQAAPEFASIAAAGLALPAIGLPTSPAGAVSSPGQVQAKRAGFWFNINAELIIYGATEPDATVTLDGRRIRLRPDGSFSFRFALPDGEFELPVVAISADETDGRAVELVFSRKTTYRGDVGVHPQDPELKRPGAAHG